MIKKILVEKCDILSFGGTSYVFESKNKRYVVKMRYLEKFGIFESEQLVNKVICVDSDNIFENGTLRFIEEAFEVVSSSEKIIIAKTSTKEPYKKPVFFSDENHDEEQNDSDSKISGSLNDDEDLKPLFEWSNINYNKFSAHDCEVETQSTQRKKSEQNLLNQAFEQNTYACYYRAVAASRAIDTYDFRHFKTSSVEDFLTGKKSTLVVESPKQINSNTKLSVEGIERDYSNFITKKTFEAFKNEKISYHEVISEINDKIFTRFQSIKGLIRQANELRIDTGSWSLFASWPFIEGNLYGTAIRTPLLYTQIMVEQKGEKFIFSKLDGESYKINAHLIYSKYQKNQSIPVDLKTNFDSIEGIFREYSKHGITIKGSLGEFQKFQTIKKDDFIIPPAINEFEIQNLAIFENIIKSEEIFNDFSRILKQFNEISVPKDNKNLFGEDLEELNYELQPFNLDNNKNQVMSAAIDDSLTIFGPPGTGKSEVITAILAKSSSEGFNNLVVTEKDAALSVLVDRLHGKYGLDMFVLKLNGQEMSSKRIFWDKVRAIFKLIASEKTIDEISMIDDKFEELMNDYTEFVKNATEHLGLDEENIIDEIASFWEYYERAEKIRQIIGVSKNDLDNDIEEIKLAIDEYEKNEGVLNSLNDQISKLNYELEISQQSHNAILESLDEILKPPLCYVMVEYDEKNRLWEHGDDLLLFKWLSAGHYGFLAQKKEFRALHSKILEAKKISKKLYNLNFHEFKKKITEQIEHNNSQVTEVSNKMKVIHKKYNFENLDTLKKLMLIDEDTITRFSNAEWLFKDYFKKQFEEPQIAYEVFKKKISDLFKLNIIHLKHKIINNIRRKIEESAELKSDFLKLKTLSQFSTLNKLPKPGEIVKKYFDIITLIMPIMLSTPSEVSRFLPYDPNIFGYGIFDEASQMFLERAMPSIHRCKKIIIAGDEHQLSPSAFFTARNNVDADYDEMDIEDIQNTATSLLDWGKAKYKKTMLIRHYRSTNAKLIEYSNIAFYDGKLEALDKPNAETKPIVYQNIKGQWDADKRVNDEEAQFVLATTKELIRKFDSVGIITMNATQQKYIRDLIDLPENEELTSIVNESEIGRGQKRIFIKNIENVQGDESDAIIFSLCYAPNEKGRIVLPQSNFLNSNRLNVAITRARHKMYVVSSFDSEEIGNSSEVKKLIYNWVKWLEENTSNFDESTKERVENTELVFRSVFEEEFFEILSEKLPNGLIAKPNFVTNNYELDLVIFDTASNLFVGAIELDGFLYHNSPEQRMKDYEKTKFLEELDWNIVRVWSTAFWRNKEDVVANTLIKLGITPR